MDTGSQMSTTVAGRAVPTVVQVLLQPPAEGGVQGGAGRAFATAGPWSLRG